MIYGIRGMAALNAARAVITAICIFWTSAHGNDGSEIYKTKNGFRYPIQKSRGGGYKIKSGEMIRVCMTSDFFLEEADRVERRGVGDY